MLLFRTLWRGVREDPEFHALVVVIGFILGEGTLFNWQVEGWSLVDSLYFCVITMATIGYGDLALSSTLSKLFTVGFVILGIGLFATFVGKIVALPVKPGQSIRFPVEAKGRFEPVTINKWIGEHSINVPDMHLDDTGAAEVLDTVGKKK